VAADDVHSRWELHLWAHRPARPVAPKRICWPRPALTAWANSASATLKAMMKTVGNSSQNVRPVAGKEATQLHGDVAYVHSGPDTQWTSARWSVGQSSIALRQLEGVLEHLNSRPEGSF
jgi:hypothetical protein